MLAPVVVLGFSGTLLPALHSGCPSAHPPTLREHCLRPPSPALVICRPSVGGHSEGCEVLFDCGFDLHLSDG